MIFSAISFSPGGSVPAQASKSTETDKVGEHLHNQMKDFAGLTGKLSFNAKGDRAGEVYKVYKVNAQGVFILQP